MMAGHGSDPETAGGPARHIPVLLDEVVSALEPLERPVNHPLEREGVGRISNDGKRTGAREVRLDSLRLRRKFLLTSREQGDVAPLACKRARDRTTHPGRGAAHDRDASAQAEVHGGRSIDPVVGVISLA